MEDNGPKDWTFYKIMKLAIETAPEILPDPKELYEWAKCNMKDKITGKDVGIVQYEVWRDWYARPTLYAYIAQLAIKAAKDNMPSNEYITKEYIEQYYVKGGKK